MRNLDQVIKDLPHNQRAKVKARARMLVKKEIRRSEKLAAKLTIYGAGKMTDKGRSDLVVWMRNQIALLKANQLTTGRYTAGYRYCR